MATRPPDPRLKGPVGIREVSLRASVSIGTVSNVLNRPDVVAPDTLARVTAIMDELGFVRNNLARQLKMGSGTTIGLILLSAENPFFAGLAHACEEAAEELGMTTILGSSDQSQARENRYIDLFEEQRVRGVLIAPTDGVTARMERLQERGSSLVLFDTGSDQQLFDTVSLDGRAAGKMAAQHLIHGGARRIALVGGPLHLVEDRWSGLTEEVARHPGISVTHIDTADQTVAAGRAAGTHVAGLPAHERPDALFGANDLLAMGLLHAIVLREGMAVPRDISIMGYDDIDFSESAIVPLTSIRQPRRELADEAFRLLLAPAEAAARPKERIRLEPQLIVRQSTRSARR